MFLFIIPFEPSLAGIIAPIMTGWLIDLTGNYQGAFFLLAGLTGFAVLTVIFFHHPDKKRKARGAIEIPL